MEPSTQTLDQSAQRSTKICTPVLTQRNHGQHASSRCTLSVQIRVRGHRVLPTSREGATMEVRHQERDGILSGGQERYEGRMPRIPALLPQDPHQRRCASSTHIRDRAHGMVREASSCETIGTVMGSGRGSNRRSTQGQAVHERKRPKATSRGQRRHLGRQRPGRHGTGATIAYARST